MRDGEIARTGAVYRSAALGRVQGGLLMRFGEETFRPLVRLGLGLQGAGQSAELEALSIPPHVAERAYRATIKPWGTAVAS